VAVPLGNWGSPEAVPALAAALNDEEPLVRGHVAWALGRISVGPAASPDDIADVAAAFLRRVAVADDAWVRQEVSVALAS
jgi:epoxyqueuosine reductase